LKNLFGKWCKPNYNSVTATFCHNIAHDLPITISDPHTAIELCYVDDVVASFLRELEANDRTEIVEDEIPSYRLSLGELAGRIQAFQQMRDSLVLPNFSDPLNHALYATYLSYVPPEKLEEELLIRTDSRGSLAEFLKADSAGQIFLSRTKPGIARGNHYHHSKTEKFLIVEGEGLIRMRQILQDEIIEFRVRGRDYRVINIPPGYTHSIENIGTGELVTLFWASEVFDVNRPDTYYLPVSVVEPVECKGS
jgi:UDP-2-acetamido-2,6-beta-L-arabino-hexul-4-ose reductase